VGLKLTLGFLTTHSIILQGLVKDGLYVFPKLLHNNNCIFFNNVREIDKSLFKLLHYCLRHLASLIVSLVLRSCNIACNNTKDFCKPCIVAKANQFPFKSSQSLYTLPLQLIYVDIRGPSPVTSTNGCRYCKTIKDL